MTLVPFPRSAGSATQPRRRLVVGLVNNMPDAALAATEQQFAELLRAATRDHDVDIALFSLPTVRRGDAARAAMAGRYRDVADLPHARLDGLIVTGAEPRTPEIEDESYWPGLARLTDFTRASGLPTIWSCLAAHAAVLRLDGIQRRRLPAKLSGVFRLATAAADDPLLDGAPRRLLAPHSRLNGLLEADLLRAGYQVLTRSDVAGVDAFVNRIGGGPSLFLQGHPEYDGGALLREYLRDVGRFLRGERPRHPAAPCGLVDPETERALNGLAAAARRRPTPDLIVAYRNALAGARPRPVWKPTAVSLYRNWLAEIALEADARATAV